jgi:phosphatidylglycerophosphatase C
MKRIYLIDFDGTISNNDSFLSFTFFALDTILTLKYWISVMFLFAFRSKSELKELFYLNFKEYSPNELNLLCNRFVNLKLKKSIKKSFLEYIKNIDKSSTIVVVSASIYSYLNPWCSEMGFDLISTELEVIDGKLTGKFLTPNCNGKEKVRRIKQKYNLLEYDEIHVFGNSKGDFQMLELGSHKYYKFFK